MYLFKSWRCYNVSELNGGASAEAIASMSLVMYLKGNIYDRHRYVCICKLDNSRGLLLENEEDGLASAGEFVGGSGVLRMWEGGVIDCFEDRRIATESVCCPCYRFGMNVKRAGLGSCLLPGIIHLIFALAATVSAITFVVTGRHHFIYLSLLLTILLGTYMGYHRSRIRKKLNIRGSDSNVGDCIYHIVCPCCSLCQEARTLEMNNVQDGNWRGRGDTVCIGNMNDGNKTSVELLPPSHLSMIT